MLSALHANAPVSDYPEQMMLYGQFVGAWEGFDRFPSPNGVDEVSCEVVFDWVLEGRAIQDVWIAPARKDRLTALPPENLYGTTFRVYDPDRDE